MKNENRQGRLGKLEQLSEEMRTRIIELAMHSTLVDTVLALQREGVDVSVPTLSRFVRKHRETLLMEEGEEMKETTAALAARGKESQFRVGTLEAVRQRLYERALVLQSPEEARELYAELVKEEGKLRELELEARRVAVAEEQVKVQRLRAEADVAVKRQKAIVTASEGVVDMVGEADGVRKQLSEADRAGLEPSGPGAKQLADRSGGGSEEKWVHLFREITAILNRGGDPGEKILEARERLSEEMRVMGTTGT
jgi:hypothetical protein